jgi:hypothetical protein
MTQFIEVVTKNGFRKTINAAKIININETRSGSVIVVEGMYEPIFCVDSYDEVHKMLGALGHEVIEPKPQDQLVPVAEWSPPSNIGDYERMSIQEIEER